MKMTILLILMCSQSALAQSIVCSTQPTGALSSHRDLLASGGYGFCTADSCDTNLGFEAMPINGKCQKPPVVSWLSNSQTLEESEQTLVLRAQSSRAKSEAYSVSLSTVGSVGTSSDFEVPSLVNFSAGQSISDPISIKLHKTLGVQPMRVLNLKIAASSISITINDSEASTQVNLTIDPQTSDPLESTLTQNLGLTFSDSLSTIFPKKIKVKIGAKNYFVTVPAKAKSVLVPIPTGDFPVETDQLVSVDGLLGSGNFRVHSIYSHYAGEPDIRSICGDAAGPGVIFAQKVVAVGDGQTHYLGKASFVVQGHGILDSSSFYVDFYLADGSGEQLGQKIGTAHIKTPVAISSPALVSFYSDEAIPFTSGQTLFLVIGNTSPSGSFSIGMTNGYPDFYIGNSGASIADEGVRASFELSGVAH